MPTVPNSYGNRGPKPTPDNLLLVAAQMHAEGKFAQNQTMPYEEFEQSARDTPSGGVLWEGSASRGLLKDLEKQPRGFPVERSNPEVQELMKNPPGDIEFLDLPEQFKDSIFMRKRKPEPKKEKLEDLVS